MTLRTVSKVCLLHSAARQNARLVNSHLSISPDLPVTTPPPPPKPVPSSPSYTRVPRPPGLSASNRKDTHATQPPAQAAAPEVAHKAGQTTRTDDGGQGRGPPAEERAAAQTSQQGSDELASAVALDLFLLRTLSQLEERAEVGRGQEGAMLQPPVQKDWATLQTLLQQQREREGEVVEGTTLEYEPTPSPPRRIRLDGRAGPEEGAIAGQEEQDGVVVVAHVMGGRDTRVSICSGFAIGRTQEGEGQMILTCAHTLASMAKFVPLASDIPSATFVLASSGHVYTVASLVSSLSEADLLLLQLSPAPINPSALPVRPLRPLPINPYPSPTSTAISVHRYLNPLSRLRRKLQKLPEREWFEGEVREYRDPIGRTAEVGTYDTLQSMMISCTPTPGSSGGPVVDRETGSVVGVTRGSTHKYGDRQQFGLATPAERIYDMFPLPGFKTAAQRQAEAEEQRRNAKGADEAEPRSK